MLHMRVGTPYDDGYGPNRRPCMVPAEGRQGAHPIVDDVGLKAEISRRLASKLLPLGPGIVIRSCRGTSGVCDACGQRIGIDDEQSHVMGMSADRLRTCTLAMHLDCHRLWTELSSYPSGRYRRADADDRQSATKKAAP